MTCKVFHLTSDRNVSVSVLPRVFRCLETCINPSLKMQKSEILQSLTYICFNQPLALYLVLVTMLHSTTVFLSSHLYSLLFFSLWAKRSVQKIFLLFSLSLFFPLFPNCIWFWGVYNHLSILAPINHLTLPKPQSGKKRGSEYLWKIYNTTTRRQNRAQNHSTRPLPTKH